MEEDSKPESVAAAMRRINRAWLEGEVEKLVPLVDPEIVMALPGFAGRSRGREEFVAGFADFCRNAIVHEFREHDDQVDTGNTGWTAPANHCASEHTTASYG